MGIAYLRSWNTHISTGLMKTVIKVLLRYRYKTRKSTTNRSKI